MYVCIYTYVCMHICIYTHTHILYNIGLKTAFPMASDAFLQRLTTK